MNTPSQGKRKLSNVSMDSKKQRRTSIAPKAVKTNINSSSNFMRSRTSRNNGKRCQTNSPTLIQNNRELATALNKAKSRVKELEDQRFELQGDRHRLMEKYSALTEQLQKMKDEHAVKQSIDNKIFKEVCELLRSKLQQATEKLLESSVFLAEVDQSVSALLKMSNLQDGENQNRSLELSLPLEITCDDSLQGSNEAALSITKLTPSPSSASSSDSCEMTSPDSSDNSLPNRAGLLTTIEDNNSTLEISDLRLVLTSTQTSTVREVLNASQESMDCHNNSRELDSTHVQPRSMDVDSPLPSSNEPSHTLCSTPDCSPIFCARGNPPHRLASTPEDREIPRYAANLTEDSPQLSPVFTLSAGRRTSRRRNTIDGFQGYKEPLLNSKLRQGDPFTDSSFFQTSQKNPSKKKKTK